jgi:murein DD-endopeptidase MepM/ murein hydrolase activator NlpD
VLLSIDAEVTKLSDLEKSLELKRDELTEERAERERILDVTKGQEELFAQYVMNQQEQMENVALAWKNAQDRYIGKFQNLGKQYGCDLSKDPLEMRQECRDFRSFFQAERSLMQSASLIQSGTVNIFSWPVSTNRLSSFFHDPDYFSLLGSSHDAIDIPVSQGTPVRAPADGYIYYILPPTPG